MSNTKCTNDYVVYAGSDRREMLPFIPVSAKSILDVGCSTGNFAALIKRERDVEIWGIEPDAAAAQLASQSLDRVTNAEFDAKLNFCGKQFDCVVFNDVLEHMVDPYSAIEYAKSLLAPDGCVVASIPNVRFFNNVWNLVVCRAWDYTDTGILDRTHLRFFTKDSIVRTFNSLGFVVNRIVGINSLQLCSPRYWRKFKVLNILTMKNISDMEWMQFAIVAKPIVQGEPNHQFVNQK